MAGVAELILRIIGKDDASGTLKGVGANLASLEKGALVAGAGITAAGAGIEAFARSQQEMNVQVRQNAAQLGVSEGEYRKLATSIANAGFPLEDVTALMQTGRQEGLRSADQLKEYANFWDTVADATGLAGPALAEGATGLRAVGVAAGEEGKALDAFGFVTNNTKIGVDGFLQVLERKGATLKEFGVNVNDAAAILGVMEKQGLTGRAAMTEFERAIEDSDGSLEGIIGNLDITRDQFDQMRGKVEGSGAALETNAAIADEAITPMQKLQQKVSELAFEHAGLIQQAANLAPAMTAVGPATAAASAGIRGVGMAATFAKGPLLSMGMALLTPPLGIIIALAAVGVAAYIFRDDIIGAFQAAWDYVKPIVEGFVGGLQSVLDFGRDHWPEIATLISGPFFPIVALATDAFGIRSALTDAMTKTKDFVGEKVDGIVDFFVKLPGRVLAALGDIGSFLYDAGKKLVGGFFGGITDAFTGGIGGIKSKLDPRNWDIPGLSPFVPAMHHAGQLGGSALIAGIVRSISEGRPMIGGAVALAIAPATGAGNPNPYGSMTSVFATNPNTFGATPNATPGTAGSGIIDFKQQMYINGELHFWNGKTWIPVSSINGADFMTGTGNGPGVHSPSLPAVPGMDWVFDRGKWELVPRGTRFDFVADEGGPTGHYTNGRWELRGSGGPVLPGRGYIVGDKGPEAFVPDRPGRIIPNDQLNGGVSLTITGPVTVNNVGERRDTEGTLKELAFATAHQIRRRGGWVMA